MLIISYATTNDASILDGILEITIRLEITANIGFPWSSVIQSIEIHFVNRSNHVQLSSTSRHVNSAADDATDDVTGSDAGWRRPGLPVHAGDIRGGAVNRRWDINPVISTDTVQHVQKKKH